MLSAIEPRILVLAPLAEEWSILLRACEERRPTEIISCLKLPCSYVPAWRMALAQGGHGKTQFAVQAQYLIGRFPSATLLVCVGAAGSLVTDLSVGDLVVGTETVEHDYRLLFAGALSGGARSICIGYAARGVAGLHGGCVALPAGEPPMSIEIILTGAALGAEIRGVDLARPIDDETFAAIERAYNDHAVIFFRDQHITPPQQRLPAVLAKSSSTSSVNDGACKAARRSSSSPT